jgi:hypothetical protein
MASRSEQDAAYFTLLRAREELDHLRRYEEFLQEELDRLDAASESVRRGAELVPRKFRRMVESTDGPLLEAIGRRRSIVLSERDKVPERISAQEAFVAECEEEVARLR